MSFSKVDRRVAVGEEGNELAVSFFIPGDIATVGPAVLFLLPGGGFNRHYYDIQVDGFEGYSQCEYHASNGLLCVAVDHLGVGDSDIPLCASQSGPTPEAPTSAVSISLAMLAESIDELVRIIVTGLGEGDCVPGLAAIESPRAIGVGQSMGGHIVAMAQAHYKTFDAVAMLGTSFTQTRLVPRQDARPTFRALPFETRMATELGNVDMRASFHGLDHPAALVDMDMDTRTLALWRSATVPGSAVELMKPAVLAREAAAVHVPVLLVYGETDVTAEPLDDVRAFTATADISLLIVPGMGHMHNFAPTRSTVWARIELFARACISLHNLQTLHRKDEHA